jgi:CMP-N,N'-diacetyllegionaminic acid synthase
MEKLFLIPARGGSKGIPSKNIKLLNGKPLLQYTIEYSRSFVADSDICLSSDDDAIIKCAADLGLKVPFKRPVGLGADDTPMDSVINHALEYYNSIGKKYDVIVLLQPTSPLRQPFHFLQAMHYFSDVDMVVSVCKSKANPYFNLFEEDEKGFLHISKGDGTVSSRQQAPSVYQYNGALYIINISSFLKYGSLSRFQNIRKYIMEEKFSVDIDDYDDWTHAENCLKELSK